MKQEHIEKHSMAQSIILHLLPGVLVECFYLLARQPVANLGYPSIVALILAFAFVLIPVELGYLLYQGKKKTGRFTLLGLISYREPIPWRQYFQWVFFIFIAVGAIFTGLKPVDAFLQGRLFSWMPEPGYGLDGMYSRKTLIVTYALVFIFVAVLSPLVEELYFRGYLLPRMKGKYATFFSQLPVFGAAFLHSVDADHENPGITSAALWGKKEKHLYWHHRPHAGQPDECGHWHSIYGPDDVRSSPRKSFCSVPQVQKPVPTATRNSICSSQPEISATAPAGVTNYLLGLWRFSLTITTSITSYGDDASQHEDVPYGQMNDERRIRGMK